MDPARHAPGKDHWHTVALFKKAAVTFAERTLKKGDLVIVEGRLENRSYQTDGQTHHVAEIAVREGRGDIHLMAKAGAERAEPAPRRSRAAAQPGGLL
jgi:single-stranded DNA-binding protein